MKKLKKLIYVGCLALAVLGLQVFGANNFQKVYAYSPTNFENVSLSNSNFAIDGTNTTNLNTNPTSWESISTTGIATKGVINTGTGFADRISGYKLPADTTNPKSANDSDNMILMVNANTDSGENYVIQGYKSSTITLAPYSYYTISVAVKTINNATASVVLKGINDSQVSDISTCYINEISSIAWKSYSFYIATSFDKVDVNLELYLGNISTDSSSASKGIAFFDDVRIQKCSENYFVNLTLASTSNIVEFNVYNNDIENLDFENGLTNWTKTGTYTSQTYTAKPTQINTTVDTTLGTDNSYNNTKALLLSADENNKVYVGYNSPLIPIQKNGYYRIAVNVKCEDISGNVYARLNETEFLKDNYNFSNYETKSANISISSKTSNALKNDYSTLEFYVSGHELYDSNVQLELSLGNADNLSSGTVVFDNVSVENIPYSIYNAVSTSTLIQTLKLTSISGTPTIANGYFNLGHSEDIIPSYPLTPNDWAQDEKGTNTVFGIINTADWDNIDATKKPITNPWNANITYNGMTVIVPNGTSNNVLMMYNKGATTQSVKSPELSLSNDSYYTLSFNFQTREANTLNFKVLNSEGIVVYQDLGLTNSAWDYYKLTVNTEYYTSTLTLVFELDTETVNKASCVFLDNFQLVKESYSDSNYTTITNNNENVLDFGNGGFNLIGSEIIDGISEALMFTSSENTQSTNAGIGGIINQIVNSNSKNMLTIQTTGITDYNLTSKDSITLSANSYYKFVINIKTVFEETHLNESESDYGAYFNIIGLTDSQIKNIKTNGQFTEYTILVKCDNETEVQVQFGFKSDSTESLGYALYDNYSYEEIDKTAYTSTPASSTVLLVNNVGIEDEEEDSEATDSAGSVNIWIAISTIIMVLAMVIAIVGAMLRKVEIKKFKVKKQVEYDRQATLVRDVAFAEAEKRRNEEIKTLEKEKEQLNKYLEEIDEDNKKRLAEERKTSGKEITRKAEREFRVYASHRQKIVKDIDKMNDRIKEAQSPEYLMRIVKIVQNEKVKKIMESETEQTDKKD